MLIRLSGWWTDMRGKNGGSCVSKNHYGLYWKNWAVPRNPKSAEQIQNRQTWAAIVELWKSITDDQRNRWNELAKTIKKQNRVGESYVPTGYSVFISCNQNRALLGLAPLSDAPDKPTITQFTNFTIAINNPALRIELGFTPQTPTTGIFYLIYITRAFSPGKSQMSMNFRQCPTMADNVFANRLNFSEYHTIWKFYFFPGYRYFLKAIPIHAASGFAGLELKNNFIYVNGLFTLNMNSLNYNCRLS
jgi:hypothetical protein